MAKTKNKGVNDFIEVIGARVHNLKDIDLNIPRNQLVVITGISDALFALKKALVDNPTMQLTRRTDISGTGLLLSPSAMSSALRTMRDQRTRKLAAS